MSGSERFKGFGQSHKSFKQTEAGIIPLDWDTVPLESITPPNRKNGIVDGPFGSNLKTIHYRTSGIPIITSGYVTDGIFHAEKYLYVDPSKFQEEKRSAVYPGDIVMAKIGERCGASAILPFNHEVGILSGNALKITVDESRHCTPYVWQVLWNLHVSGKLVELRTVGAQPALSMASLKRFKIPVPPTRTEQLAISTALSDVDALLGALDRLIAKKRDLKQAAMQQLLTGQTRLPGFKGEWVVKTLEEIGEAVAGLTYAPSDVCGEGGTLVLRASNVDNGMLTYDDTVYVSMDLPSRVFVRKGDILICVRNGSRNLIGKCAQVDEQAERHGHVFGAFMAVFRSEYNNFVYHHFQSGEIKRQIHEHLGATINQITNRSLNAFEIPFPDQQEQTAISEVLSDMDAEIAALEQRREKTLALKQGMMQELLTGRTRLI